MTASLARERLSVQLAVDRHVRASGAAQAIRAETYLSSSGVAGSTLYDWMTGGVQAAGIVVNERTAMCVSTIFACVGLIGGAIASLPLEIYRRMGEGDQERERLNSDLWWLFNESPWPTYTAASAWEQAMQSVLLQGDGFWRIHRASRLSPKIVGFEPLHPNWVSVLRQDGRNVYVISYPLQEQAVVDQDDMLHFPGVGFDGIRSLTPIRHALRTGAGIAIAADESAAAFFNKGARSDLLLTSPAKISDAQQEQLRDGWDKRNAGSRNATYPIVLGGSDWKVEQIGLNAEDMQLLSTRQYQVEDICRIMGTPPHLVGKTDAATSWGSGIESMGIGFVTYTLRRHFNRITQEINRKCWPRSLKIFAEFNADALMAGDSKAQAEFFSKALGGPGAQGYMSVNEVRRKKNMKPLGPEWDQVTKAGTVPPSSSNNADTSNANPDAEGDNNASADKTVDQ